MSRKRTQATATAETVVAASQTEQAQVQDGGQAAPVAETTVLTTEVIATASTQVDVVGGDAQQSAGEESDGTREQDLGTETTVLTTEVIATQEPEVLPSLVVVNNSPSLMPIPVIDAIIDPYGSHVVPEWMFEDSDRMTRLKTEASALNEAKGYEMIELRFSVATAE